MSETTILPDGSAFSVGTIMSEEEAMKLPLKDRPICFRLSSEMYHQVWESIGAASMTFKTEAGNEVFNTEQASKIAMDLMFKIANEKESALSTANSTIERLQGNLHQSNDANMVLNHECAKALSERDSLLTQLAQARDALKQYGSHQGVCERVYQRGFVSDDKFICTCGFKAALQPTTEKE